MTDDDYEQTLRDRALAVEEARRQPREEVSAVRDLEADGVPCRLYEPADDVRSRSDGLVVHVHGGGFVFHDVEVHDAPCRRLANRTGLAVLSVDYRLAPESPYPAAVEDLDAVVGWLRRQHRDPGHRAVIHGDSAGGNLALVAALRHPGAFHAMVLVYPFLDPSGGFASYELAESNWDREEARWYWSQYAPGADPRDPDLAPLHSDRLGTLPPTLVITAEHDIARDEGEHLARRLRDEGVSVQAVRHLGVPHGFWRGFESHPESDLAMRQVGGFLAGLGQGLEG